MSIRFTDLCDVLPAGEWENLQEVQNVEGMMAARTDTLYVSATWLRDGGVPAFLKCIVARGASAGPDTARLVAHDRLERLRDRLSLVRAAEHPAIVRLIAVEMLKTSPPVLLIAMEQVERLHELITRSAPDLSMGLSVLESLAADETWIHFDICPRNTGRAGDGRYVFIDPDSLYNSEAANVELSVPACKPRLPPTLAAIWKIALTSDGLPVDIAREKHNAEVIVLAAECCLGTFQYTLNLAGIDRWCDGALVSGSIREFWRRELRELHDRCVDSPVNVASRLRAVPDPANVTSTVAFVAVPAPVPVAPAGGIAGLHDWEAMEPVRRALRADRLGREELGNYRETLLTRARADRSALRWWEELLVVTMAYEQNPELALRVVDEAISLFPDHAPFLNDRQVLVLWNR